MPAILEPSDVYLSRAEVRGICGIAESTLRLHQTGKRITFTEHRISLSRFNKYLAKYHLGILPLTVEELYERRAAKEEEIQPVPAQ